MDEKKNKRVLIVDDDTQFREATRMMLEKHGYDVVTANDGDEGLRCAERESLDLIVLDVMMPRRSGFGVLERIGCRAADGPRIVVVTANSEERQQEIAREKGADVFLRKPFDMRELLQTVDTLLHV